MTRILGLTFLLSLSACHLGRHDRVEVDGVRLPDEHEEILTLESWPAGGLVIEAHLGDLRIETGPGPTTLTVLVHERSPGEAHAHLEGNRLVARAAEGATCALGRVVVRTAGPVEGLTLSTGMGDVVLDGVRVLGNLSLSTGMGDVEVRGAGEPESVRISTGMGDVSVGALACRRLEASSGMGDVSVNGLAAEEVEVSSGMGDVSIRGSKGGSVKAGTGLGDVDLAESSFATRELDSGLGRVREH
jgi:hypothetical protein